MTSNPNESLNVTVASYIPYNQRIETYVVPVLFALIFIVGILGNGTLVIIFARNKNLRNVPNTYIINLAMGDILVLMISLPFTSTIYTIESWPYGELICKLSDFVKETSIGVSVFTLTALSVDRYFAIVAPMRHHMGSFAGQGTIIVAVAIWILSVVLACPTAILSYVRHVNDTGTEPFDVCWPYPDYIWEDYPKLNVMMKFLFYYLLPLLIISGFYAAMANHLVKSSKNMPGEPQGQQSRQIEARKKVAKVVLSFVVIFAVCFFPNHVFFLWFYFNSSAHQDYDDFWHACRIIGFCLCFINSCINPIALYCVSGVFRKYYNQYLFCCLASPQSKRGGRGKLDRQSTLVNFNSTFRRTSTSMSMLQSASL